MGRWQWGSRFWVRPGKLGKTWKLGLTWKIGFDLENILIASGVKAIIFLYRRLALMRLIQLGNVSF